MKRFVLLAGGCLLAALATADAQTPNKKDLPKYIKDLSAKDAKVRLAGVEGIAAIGEIKAIYAKDAVVPLGETLVKDDDAKVREAAAKALYRIDADPEKAVPPVIDRLKNEKDRAALEASIAAAGYFKKAAIDAVPLLKDISAKYKEEADGFNAEAKKFQDEGDKKKAQEARQKAQGAGRMVQACNAALKSIAEAK